MTHDSAKLSQALLAELNALKDLDQPVPARAFDLAANLDVVAEYIRSELKISDLADMFCDLAVI